jgi:hypothetical protein
MARGREGERGVGRVGIGVVKVGRGIVKGRPSRWERGCETNGEVVREVGRDRDRQGERVGVVCWGQERV